MRTALSERGLAYVLAVQSDVSAHYFDESAHQLPQQGPRRGDQAGTPSR
ncbi:hypothetical protein ACWCQQ_33760 [Streptomyces sp. NPDC002143]